MIKKIAVVGCGWFGLPLARALQNEGYQVIGSKRHADEAQKLTREGIDCVALDLSEPEVVGTARETLTPLLDVDAMVINIPPALRSGKTDYLERLKRFKQMMLPGRLQRLIFISSTGVYPPGSDCLETEVLPQQTSESLLLQAEYLLAKDPLLLAPEGGAVTLRFAGLIGPGRHPGRFLAGRTNLTGARHHVNLVHLNDCIGATVTVLKAPQSSAIYNLCAPEHATKQAFYTQAAQSLQLPAPEFQIDNSDIGDKRVSGDRICHELGYVYRVPTLAQMLAQC